MRNTQAEAQLSLMDGLTKRDRMEEMVTEELLMNLKNLKYAYSQIELSLIPDEIRTNALTLFAEVLTEVADFAYEASRLSGSRKYHSRVQFRNLAAVRRDLGLAETRTLDELYDLTIAVRSRLKTALNRFEDVIGEPEGCDIDRTLEKLLNVAQELDVI